MLKLMEQIRYKKGKGRKSLNCIFVKDDIPDDKNDDNLKSEIKDTLKLQISWLKWLLMCVLCI